MTLASIFTPGRILILLGNLFYAAGSFAADFNATHVYNPRWPPHAKFHNGQTMSLAIMLALTSSWLLYNSAGARGREREYIFWAAVVGSLYCGAGLTAILFPGTDWVDPEFYVEGQLTQKSIFGGTVVAMWVGYGFEVWRAGSTDNEGREKGE